MKICKLCGENCSTRPRVKDAEGSYYCKTCHAAAVEQREEREAAALGHADVALGDDLEPADEYSVLDDILPAATTQASSGRQCAGCGTPLTADAQVCTNCGMNLSSGEQMQVHVMKAAPSGGGQVWPVIIGVCCLVFAVAEIALRVFEMTQSSGPSLGTAEGAGYRTGSIVGNGIGVMFSIWLLVAGIGVLRRQQTGAASLLKWAKYKTILGATCFAFAVGTTFIALNSQPQFATGPAGAESVAFNAAMTGAVIAALIVLALVSLAWPIFIWIFLTRSKIENQIAQWG